MKTESGSRHHQSLSFIFVLAFLYCLTFATAPLNLRADGCFVVPKFVWDKHRDINEPTQKAIIINDAGREELMLQVKYDGPLEEFGWLIPVPNLPTVKKGSMECFYELSKFTQKNLEPRRGQYSSASLSKGRPGGEEDEPPVKVIEIKTVGAYDIVVLSTKNSAALENWLKGNQFTFPANATDVIDRYVKQGWYFIAVKINLKGGSLNAASKELASGELHPLQISFASERCVFPLKISSLNHTPSEVQVYVLSSEPLVERKLFEQELSANYSWRTNMLAKRAEWDEHFRAQQASRLGGLGRLSTSLPPMNQETDNQLSSQFEINPEKLIPYAPVGRKAIPVCSREITLLNKRGASWLMKQTWTFQPEEMRDLEFESAVPVMAAALAEGEGAFAAANLQRLGTNGASALIAAMQNTNPAVRAHAMSVAEEMFVVTPNNGSSDDRELDPSHRMLNPELMWLLPKLLNDADPEVRLHAVYAVENSGNPIFFNRMMEMVRDDYLEISEGAQGYLKQQRNELPKHASEVRRMLQDTNVNAKIAGIRLLNSVAGINISRDELLPLFSVPRMEVAGGAVAYLRNQGISCEEAKPLLNNSLLMARMMGLKILATELNNQSVELAIPLLKDPEAVIRLRAHDLLTDLTGQDFPAEPPEQWEKWWEQNKATFTVNINPDELRQKQLERARQRRAMENNSPP